MKLLILPLIILSLTGCDSSNTSGKTAEQIQQDLVEHQRKFAAEKQRIENEVVAREKKLAEQRSLVSARFVSVTKDYVDVELSNLTSKNIDNIVGSLEVIDQAGEHVMGVALTNWVPGDIYLPIGATAPARKSLQLERPETLERILKEAENYTYYYTVLRIQYEGEAETNFMEPPTTKMVTVVEKPKDTNPNQAEPEPCSPGQLSIETEEQYYPGPKCEHVERNIDSERFKQEFIQLCQSARGAAKAPPSADRVQLSSCMAAPSGTGVVFRKRICCS